MRHLNLAKAVLCLLAGGMLQGLSHAADEPAWQTAYRQAKPSAEETRDLMMRLARFVYDNHLKKTAQWLEYVTLPQTP